MQAENQLYPVFLRPDRVSFMILGGGPVAEEKLFFLFKNSPQARVSIFSPSTDSNKSVLARKYPQATLIDRYPTETEIRKFQIAIITLDNSEDAVHWFNKLRTFGLLTQAADQPELCDFYQGGIVSRGPLKIAISTNGFAPVLASRIRQWLEAAIPEETTDLLVELAQIRKKLKGDFAHKVKALRQLTSNFNTYYHDTETEKTNHSN